MPVPDYQTLMLPVLKCFADGATSVKECIEPIAALYDLTQEEREELIPSGRTTLFSNRVHWARTYLSKADLLHSPKRNHHEITERGLALLASNPNRIVNSALAEFDDFDARCSSKTDSETEPSHQTPQERIAQAHATLEQALKEELLEQLYQVTPTRLERIILDLLSTMGYGGGDLSRAHMTRGSNDEGIDGVIYEDALELDAVYIQVKRYQKGNTVGRPALQQFAGSLSGFGASKGVFVTTSDFSKEAQSFCDKAQQRITLINGPRLATLMLRYDIGVRGVCRYILKELDDSFFGDD